MPLSVSPDGLGFPSLLGVLLTIVVFGICLAVTILMAGRK
jgi:hypothetical protein